MPGPLEASASLFENGYRWYRAAWGRYSQADPIDPRGFNGSYSYASNTPLELTDSRGLTPEERSWPSEEIDGLIDTMYRRWPCMRLARFAFNLSMDVDRAGGFGEPMSKGSGLKRNRFQHCLGSCWVTRYCGDSTAEIMGYLNEWQRIRVYYMKPSRYVSELRDTLTDLANNVEGKFCAFSSSCDCIDCCSSKLQNDDLWDFR
jgi:RHS repeat-associated protein